MEPAQDLSAERVLKRCARVDHEGTVRPVLGRIVLLSRLGHGGVGVVFRGVHQRLLTEVAVKLQPIAPGENDLQVRRFEREARLAARLRSDHLVQVLDIDEDEATGFPFIVMEYVRGVSAEEWRRAASDGRVTEADALDVCIAATKGLSVAHLAGIVHRDIKPSNVLIPTDDAGRPDLSRAKLADLGLARSEGVEATLTSTQIGMGTPGYLAPEQAEDARTAKKPADVFSMGATLYALLVGSSPFSGSSAADAIVRAALGRYTPLAVALPSVSAATAELVDLCLRKEPAGRFPDAPALLDALLAARAHADRTPGSAATALPVLREIAQRSEQGLPVETPVSTQQAAPTPIPPPSSSPPRRRFTFALPTSIAVLGAAALVWRLGHQTPETTGAAGLDAPTRGVLVELSDWDSQSPTLRRRAVQWVASREPDFAFDRLETFSDGGRSHEVAVFRHPRTGLEFVLVPGGRFLAGSPPTESGRDPNETQHEVVLSRPFLLCRTEVPQDAWTRIMTKNPSEIPGEKRPVEMVAWETAWAFCTRTGLELPTEAQWEFAARAGGNTAFTAGEGVESLRGRANVADATFGREREKLEESLRDAVFEAALDDGFGSTAPVGSFAPTSLGLLDVHGNVLEWVLDWYAEYDESPVTDPTGPRTPSSHRIARGGSWINPAQHCRIAQRSRILPSARYSTLGFRPSKTISLD